MSIYSVQAYPQKLETTLNESAWVLTPRLFPGDLGSLSVYVISDVDITIRGYLVLHRYDLCTNTWL